MNFLYGTEVVFTLNTEYALQDVVIERMLGGKNYVQGPLLLKLLFVGLKTMSPSILWKDNTARNKGAHWLSFCNVLLSLFNWVIL